MLGYISSTRKKSCYACVKAKRRCDLGYPFCKRCFIKGLDCTYPNAQKAPISVRDAAVVIRQSTPDFSACTRSTNELAATETETALDVNIDPLFLQYSGSSSDAGDLGPEGLINNDWSNEWGNDWAQELSALKNHTTAVPRICRTLMPQVWAPSFLNEGQVGAILRGLYAFVPDMAFSGSTQFLHRNLYQNHQPQAYQDCVALSALYLTKNTRNQSILANSIGTKISALTATASTWTLAEHVAAVQALIIYQIIRLFDPDLKLQAQAEKHNSLLELWSAHLWKRFFNEPQTFSNCHESWVFNESLRRTIMISVFVRCGWSCYTQGGLADQIPVLARLPFTKDLEAWQCDPDEWNRRAIPYITEEENLISYGEMTATWTHDREVETLDPFGKLLLAACRGDDDPRLLE